MEIPQPRDVEISPSGVDMPPSADTAILRTDGEIYCSDGVDLANEQSRSHSIDTLLAAVPELVDV